jgi:DNA-binding CsgD family transcriptional regulator
VVLREALSSRNTPLATLIRVGKDNLSAAARPAFSQVNGAKPRDYHRNRRLTTDEQAQLVEQYRSGMATRELARQFGIHRHTVAKHLKRVGVVVRGQRKMTPELVKRAKQLNAHGHSLAVIGKQLGVEASTVHKALKRAGLKMRDTHGRAT